MTEQVKLDWSTAEVSDGELTVGLNAKPPKQWQEAFEDCGAVGCGALGGDAAAEEGIGAGRFGAARR